MGLPDDPRAPWPPKRLQAIYDDIAEADAWFSGDADRLRNHYGNAGPQLPRAAGEPEKTGALGRIKFWARRSADRTPDRQQLHVPIAADIASTSADLLFSEAPTFTIPGSAEKGNTTANQAQDALDELIERAGIVNTLLEAAEVASALGDVYLRPAWDDPDVLPHPVLDVVHADAAVPEWKWGRLHAVTFWRTVHEDNRQVWRHLERHEGGVILHGLYVGDERTLGRREPLDAHPSTEGLTRGSDRRIDLDNNEVAILLPTGIDGLAVRHVPNVRPNRKHRHTPHGRSDYDGCYPMMDALDETYTSLMRDVRLGQARLLVDAQALEDRGKGRGAAFNLDREVFTPLEIDPTSDRKMVEQVQFEIRVEDHLATAMSLIERIVSNAGYSPQSFGLHIEGRAESGAALRIREAKTLRTGGRKQRYWQPAVIDELYILQVIAREHYGVKVDPVRPQMGWGDALVDDPGERATAVEMLKRAQAASTRARVKMAQPELEGDELDGEVARVMAEEGMTVADPTAVGGAQ